MNSKIIDSKRLKKGHQETPQKQGASLQLNFHWIKPLLSLNFLLFFTACLTQSVPLGKSTTSTPPAASAMAISGGNNQSITAGGSLAPLSVTVSDSNGNPVGNQTVLWNITSGSGQLPAVTSVTNSSGVATLSGTPFTLYTATATPQTITATILGTSISQTFNTTVTPSVPSLNTSSFTTSSSTLPADNATQAILTATIKDSYGNLISGNIVTFISATEVGSIIPTLSAPTATTSSSGIATITIQGSTTGLASISASTSGTVITLPSLTIAWTGVPNISSTPSTYNFITSNAPAINVVNTGGSITSCAITPNVPSSYFTFNTTTCQITPVPGVGVPMRTSYTITATNSVGSSSPLNITIAAFFYSDRNSDGMCGWSKLGQFMCWGGNASGQLGDGTTVSRNNAQITTPVATQGANTVLQSTGDSAPSSTCILTTTPSTNIIYCSGSNSNSNLGNGGTTSSTTFSPVTIPSGSNPAFVQLKNSWTGYCALTSTGDVYCWGSQQSAATEFGPYSSQSYSTPTKMSGLPAAIANIGGGAHHTCAISTSGTLSCWGLMWSDTGTTPLWSTSPSNPLLSLTNFPNPIQMSGSGEFMLFLNQTGQVAGFGNNDYSQLPGATGQQQPITSTALNPVSISSSGSNSSNIIQICATGAGYTNGKGAACALFGNGSVSCWGDNTFGQLGQGTTGTTPTATPTPVSAITNAVALFGTGSYYNGGFCALLATGSYVCWGSMYDGFNTPTLTPISGLP